MKQALRVLVFCSSLFPAPISWAQMPSATPVANNFADANSATVNPNSAASVDSLGGSQAASQTFDLRTAIQYAIQNAPQFDSLKRQLSIAGLEEKNAKSRWFPSLDLSATHGIQDQDPSIKSTPWASEFNLALTENLYDNGVISTNYKIAQLNQDIAELRFTDQKNRISLNLATAYLNYSLNVKLLEIQEKQFKLISRQYQLTSKEYYNGIRTKKDYLRFKTQTSRAEIDLVNARNAVEKSKLEILSLMGIGLVPGADPGFVPVPLDNVKDQLSDLPVELENHLQYQAAQLQKKANELNSDLTRRKKYPEWYLSAGANYSSSNYIDTNQSISDNDVVGWNALLTVKYNFLDWGIRSREAEVAAQRAIIQNNELDMNLLDLRASLNRLRINNLQIQKNFGLAQELLDLERDNIDLIEREYRNGKVSYLDLITGLNDLADSERKFFSASSDLILARFTLLYHQGKLYDEFVK